METMRAVSFDGGLPVVLDRNRPLPGPGWARIRVHLAGICKTDLEIMKGYQGFQGILGHEFLGVVDSCDDPAWIGRRVVGEINAPCGRCRWCAQGLGRHCPRRTTLGIAGLDGCMAEYCLLPTKNLYQVDRDIPDERAILVEPLAAACEILEQLPLQGNERIIVLGDGRLGILCAWTLATVTPEVSLAGHHQDKLDLARWREIRTVLGTTDLTPGADVVVDATGSRAGFEQALALCRPRGILVLKSTLADRTELNLAPLVINEITVVGSRCGCFPDALSLMHDCPDMPLERLLTRRYPLSRAPEAFEAAREPGALKVVLEC